MGPSLTYWIVASAWMALAFLAATGAILIGASRLDRASQERDNRIE